MPCLSPIPSPSICDLEHKIHAIKARADAGVRYEKPGFSAQRVGNSTVAGEVAWQAWPRG